MEITALIFDVFGPFEMPRNHEKTRIDDGHLENLKEEIEKTEHLSDACGCYLFAIRAAKGYTPWYVGRTKLHGIFDEATTPRNLRLYEKVLNEIGAGTPVLFLLPVLTASEQRFRKPSQNLYEIDFVENWLIGEALRKNNNLLNVQNTNYLKNLRIKGVLNPKPGEARAGPSAELREAIW